MSYEILYEGTDYQNLRIEWGDKVIDFYSVDKDGDIEVSLGNGWESSSFYLDQEDIKVLIEHLKKQIR